MLNLWPSTILVNNESKEITGENSAKFQIRPGYHDIRVISSDGSDPWGPISEKLWVADPISFFTFPFESKKFTLSLEERKKWVLLPN